MRFLAIEGLANKTTEVAEHKTDPLLRRHQRKPPKHPRTSMGVSKEATPSFESSISTLRRTFTDEKKITIALSFLCEGDAAEWRDQAVEAIEAREAVEDRNRQLTGDAQIADTANIPAPPFLSFLDFVHQFQARSVTPIPPPQLEPNSSMSP